MKYKYACLKCGNDTWDRGFEVKGGTLCVECKADEDLHANGGRCTNPECCTQGRNLPNYKDPRSLKNAIKKLKASGAGLAATTKGRKTTFKDRKRESARKACRGKLNDNG